MERGRRLTGDGAAVITQQVLTEAIEYAKSHERVTVSGIQRHCVVGYSKALNLIERLVNDGVLTDVGGKWFWRSAVYQPDTPAARKELR